MSYSAPPGGLNFFNLAYTGNGAASRLINAGFKIKFFQIIVTTAVAIGVTGAPDPTTGTTINCNYNGGALVVTSGFSADGTSIDVGRMQVVAGGSGVNTTGNTCFLQAYG